MCLPSCPRACHLLPRTRVCCGPGAPLAPDSRPAPDRPHSLARSTCPVAPRLPHAPVSCPRRTRSCQRSRAAEYDLTIISPPTSRVQWIGWRVSACERKCVWPARKTHLWQPPCCCSAAVTLPACRTGAHVRHQHLASASAVTPAPAQASDPQTCSCGLAVVAWSAIRPMACS